MKYKKVLALFLSAGLSAGSLASCRLSPAPAFGMEAATEREAREVEGDGSEESENPSEENPAVCADEA